MGFLGGFSRVRPGVGDFDSKHVLPFKFAFWYGATIPAYFRDVSGIVMKDLPLLRSTSPRRIVDSLLGIPASQLQGWRALHGKSRIRPESQWLKVIIGDCYGYCG